MVKLVEILPYILQFFFSNLRQIRLISCLYPLHYLTNDRVCLLSFFHFRWRHLLRALIILGCSSSSSSVIFVLKCHHTFYGESPPIDYFFHFFTDHSIWNSLIFLWLWIIVHLFWDKGMMAQHIYCFIWHTYSVFNIKIKQHKLLSHLIWAIPNLLSPTYANGLLSMYMVNLDPKR